MEQKPVAEQKPPAKQKPVGDPKTAERPTASKPVAPAIAKPAAGTKPATNAPKPMPLPKETSPFESSDSSELPFGEVAVTGTSPAITSRYLQESRGWKLGPIIATLVVLGGLGALGWHYKDKFLAAKTDSKAGPAPTTYTNVERNYSFAAPTSEWTKIEREGTDLAFVHAPSGVELSLTSSLPSETPTLASLAESAIADWSKYIIDVKEDKTENAQLDGKQALKASADGKRKEKPERIEAIVLFNEGIAYKLAMTGPAAQIGNPETDLNAAAKSFKILGSRPNWTVAAPPKIDEFASDKHPYRFKVPARKWKRLMEPDPGNRLADLRLTDPKKDALITVTPRQVSDFSDVEDAYIARQRKTFKTATVTNSDANAKAGDYEAHQLKLKIDDPDVGALLIVTTFAKSAPYIFVIECRAPADKAADYELAFAQFVQSLEVIPADQWKKSDKADSEKKTEPKGDKPENKKSAKKPAKEDSTDNDMSEDKPKERDDSEPPPPKKPPAKREEKSAPKGEEKKPEKPATKEKATPSGKSSKGKSLDDLDFDQPAKKETSKSKENKGSKKSDDEM